MYSRAYLNTNFRNLPRDRDEMIRTMQSYGINMVPEALSARNTRYILHSRKDATFSHPEGKVQLMVQRMISECNGLVMLARATGTSLAPMVEWDILGVPPPSLVSNIDTSYIDWNIDDYELFAVNEGTTVVLYYYDDAWRIATQRGYDMGKVQWTDFGSYSATIDDVLRNAIKPASSALDAAPMSPGGAEANEHLQRLFACLNKTRSYSFGFKHYSMHPFYEGNFVENISRIWFIQSAEVSESKMILRTEESILGIPTQHAVKWPVERNMRALFEYNWQAFKRFVDTAASAKPAVSYGYILRAKHGSVTYKARPNISNILLESRLLTSIRKLHYARKFKSNAQLVGIKREDFIIIYNYLSSSNGTFIKLFGQYIGEYKKMERITDNVTRGILGGLDYKFIHERKITEEKKMELIDTYNHLITTLKKVITDLVESPRDISKHAHRIIINPDYANLYYPVYLLEEITIG